MDPSERLKTGIEKNPPETGSNSTLKKVVWKATFLGEVAVLSLFPAEFPRDSWGINTWGCTPQNSPRLWISLNDGLQVVFPLVAFAWPAALLALREHHLHRVHPIRLDDKIEPCIGFSSCRRNLNQSSITTIWDLASTIGICWKIESPWVSRPCCCSNWPKFTLLHDVLLCNALPGWLIAW